MAANAMQRHVAGHLDAKAFASFLSSFVMQDRAICAISSWVSAFVATLVPAHFALPRGFLA
jgi:hypothetical protein